MTTARGAVIIAGLNDPRFDSAVALFNDGDWLEAADAFEELYFEAARGEIEIVRVLLQFSTGLHHTSRRQPRAAVSRIEEGIAAAAAVSDAHGIDLAKLCADMSRASDEIRAGGRPRTVRIQRLGGEG